MTDDFNKKKQESLGRWGTALTASIFIIGAIVLPFISTASLWVAAGLLFIGIALLWLAISASSKTAITLSEYFPISIPFW